MEQFGPIIPFALLVAFQVWLFSRWPSISVVPRRSIDGANGRNSVMSVKIAQELDDKNRIAVLAHELYEARYKTNLLRGAWVRLSKGARRKMEIMGHEIEVQAFDGNRAERRMSEAKAMHRHYEGLFSNSTPEQIYDLMFNKSSAARSWIGDHRSRIKIG